MPTTDQAQTHRDIARMVLEHAEHLALEDNARPLLFAEAQVHATLAAAEEQRTATLVAIAALGWDLTDEQRLSIAVRAGLA